MTIRKAKIEDIDRIIEMLMPFYQESEIGEGMVFDYESARRTLAILINNGMGVIFIYGDFKGSLGAVVSNWHLNNNYRIAQEMWLWVDPEYRNGMVGIRLMDAFEKWAISNDVNKLEMVSLPNDMRSKIERLYERRGFKPSEKFYSKHLGEVSNYVLEEVEEARKGIN